jgi:Tfp pilus assembly protein PilO
VIVIFGWYMIMPKRTQIKEAEDILKVNLDEKSKLDGEVATLKALIEEMRTKQRQLGYLDEALPLDARITKLQILAEKIAGDSGVTLADSNFSPQEELVFGKTPEQQKDPYSQQYSLKTISGSLYVVGVYDQVKDFLKRVEQSGRVIDVTSVELLGNRENMLDLKLNVQSYYFTP